MPSSSPAPHSLKMQAFGRARTDGVAEVSAGRGVRLRAEQLGGVEHLRGHGILEADNNWGERALKPVVMACSSARFR
jgi:hypothetical protein